MESWGAFRHIGTQYLILSANVRRAAAVWAARADDAILAEHRGDTSSAAYDGRGAGARKHAPAFVPARVVQASAWNFGILLNMDTARWARRDLAFYWW
jgi:hypothetical protein